MGTHPPPGAPGLGSGGSLTSGSQAVVLEVQSFQPMQPGELPGVDLLQLVVLGVGDKGSKEGALEAQGSCLSRGSPPPPVPGASPSVGYLPWVQTWGGARPGSEHGRPSTDHNRHAGATF